jgi:acetyl esterase/lipase
MPVARLPLPDLRPLIAAATPSPIGLANALTPRRRSERREGLAYGGDARHRLDLYLPAVGARRPRRPGAEPAPLPLLVFLYGGAWQEGDRGDYAFIARVLAARGMAVAVPDYRLWPAARWPGFVEDAAVAITWLRSEAGRAAGAPDGPLFVMGHSAGGFIAAALALDPAWLEAAGLPGGRQAIAGCIPLAAPFEWTPREEPLAAIFAAARGGAIRAAPDAAEGLLGTPPMLLLHGVDDHIVSPVQSAHMATRLRFAARPVRLKVYPGIGHIGVLAAMAAPMRALGLARAPVLRDVMAFIARGGTLAPEPPAASPPPTSLRALKRRAAAEQAMAAAGPAVPRWRRIGRVAGRPLRWRPRVTRRRTPAPPA